MSVADNYMERLKNKMRGVGAFQDWKKPPTEKTRQNLKTTRFDDRIWGEERKDSGSLNKNITDLYVGEGTRKRNDDGSIKDIEDEDYVEQDSKYREPYDNAPELVQDLWQAFYKPVTKLRDKKEVYKDVRLNRAILEEILNHPDYERIHDATMTDETMATMAVETFSDTLKDIIKRHQTEVRESNKEKFECSLPGGPGKGEGQGGQGQGQGQGGDGEDGEDGGQGGQGGGGGTDHYDDDEDLTDQPGSESLEDSADEEGEDHDGGDADDFDFDTDDLMRDINDALKEAADEVSDLDGLRKGIGLDAGAWGQMSPERRLQVLNQLKTPQMRALAEIVGRMKRFAMSMQAQKIIDAPEEPVNVKLGNDLRHILRHEFALLGNKHTTWEFYRKFVEGELLQYELQGTEEAGKGPIYVCIDKSYSMSGEPFNWAMAVAEAFRRICDEQGRDYFATFFGTNNDRHRFDFPKGETNVDKVLEFLQAIANGGTEFDGVLTEALQRCEEYGQRGAEKADIVFITDGQAHLTPEWIADFNRRREEIGARVFSVFIGGAYDYYGSRGGPVELLGSFSDVVIPVTDLREDAVKDIFAKV